MIELIKTNFLIGEFMYIVNIDWMGRNNFMSMLINQLYNQQTTTPNEKKNRSKVVLKENRIPKIITVPVPF